MRVRVLAATGSGRRCRVWLAAVLGMLLTALGPPAGAVDGIAFSSGPDASAHTRVDFYRVGAQWNWNRRWLQTAGWHLGGYWDLQAGYWKNASDHRTHSRLWELAVTPVFRIQQSAPVAVSPYLELGAGAHLLSETSVHPQRRFGGSFQFGSHAGVGARFGPHNRFDLSYRYQHLSNASIEDPNDGIDFHILRLGYWFR